MLSKKNFFLLISKIKQQKFFKLKMEPVEIKVETLEIELPKGEEEEEETGPHFSRNIFALMTI